MVPPDANNSVDTTAVEVLGRPVTLCDLGTEEGRAAAEEWVDGRVLSAHAGVLGLDCEWRAPWFRGACGCGAACGIGGKGGGRTPGQPACDVPGRGGKTCRALPP
jgi:hypothetical protein